MIVKNEEHYLRECLESLKHLLPEFVIVDTGSTDKTKEIAATFGAKLFDFPWTDNFSEARNFGLRKATGAWVLYIDADERLSPDSIPLLREVISSDEWQGIYCTLQSIDTTGGRPNMMKYIRLFRAHPDIKFHGRVHEQIYDSLSRHGYSFGNSDIKLLHVGYDISAENMKKKAERNLALLLKDYDQEPDGYTGFQIASSYGIMNQKDKAIEYFQQCLSDTSLANNYRAHANRYLAASALEKGRITDAQRFISEALNADSFAPLVNIIAGKICFQAGDLQTGFELFQTGYVHNKMLIDGQRVSPFDIMVDIKELILQGISFAVQYRNKEYFNLYLSEFKQFSKDSDRETLKEIAILNKLFHDVRLTTTELDILAKFFTPQKSQTYCELLKNQKDKKYALQAFLHIRDYYEDEYVTASTGMLFDETDRPNDALKYYKKSLVINPCNLPVLLHAVSVFVRLNQLPEAVELLKNSELNYSNDENQLVVIQSVRQKLVRLIDTAILKN